MGVTIAITRVACNTSTGTQTITTSDLGGLTPKAALFFVGYGTSDGTAANDAVYMMGAATGASNRWAVGGTDEHNLSSSNVTCNYSNTACIEIVDPNAETADGIADFDSWTTNGVVIDWTNAPASAYLLTVVLFAGTDLSAHADFEDLLNAGADSEINITAPGFEPDVVFTSLASILSAPGISTAQRETSYGIAHNDGAGGITQRGHAVFGRNSRATTDSKLWSTDDGVNAEITTAAVDFYVDLENFDSSGFSAFTRSAGANNRELCYLALSFGGAVESWVGTYSTPTSTGNDSDTGPGFTPQYLHFIHNYAETIDTYYSSSFSGPHGWSVITADNQYSTTATVENGVGTTNTQSLSDDTAIECPDHDGTTGLTASFVSFDANGWTLNYSAVEASAKLFFALAIEAEAAAAVGGSLDTPKIHPRRNALLRM